MPRQRGLSDGLCSKAHQQSCRVVIVDGGFTSSAQLLDRAVMKPFKEAVRNAAATDLAEMVVSDLDNLSTVMNRPGLKTKIVQRVHAALDEIRFKEHAFLFVTGDEVPNVLLRAHELNDSGQLFQRMVSCPSYSVMKQKLITKMLNMSPRATETCVTRMPQMMRMQVRRLQNWNRWRSKHRQLLHRRMLQHKPLQHKKRLQHRKGYRSSSTCVSHMANTHHE